MTINNSDNRCYKISDQNHLNYVKTIEGDIVYVRNHPFVYVGKTKDESGLYDKVQKIYFEKDHPKYNANIINSVDKVCMFKTDGDRDLEEIPARDGDYIYRSGDKYVYLKVIDKESTTYQRIPKIS